MSSLAQSLPEISPKPDQEQEKIVTNDQYRRDTPRAMVNGLIGALAENNYTKASLFLDLSEIQKPSREFRGRAMARLLQSVLDRSGGILPTYDLSIEAVGATDDGLPANQDRFAFIRIDGKLIDLIAHRITPAEHVPIWLVSPSSLQLLGDAALSLTPTLIEQLTPAAVSDKKFAGAPLFDWFAVLLLAIIMFTIARAFTSMLFWLLARGIPALREGRAEHVGRALLLPIGLSIACFLFSISMYFMGISVVARTKIAPIIEIVFWVAIAWIVWRAVDAIATSSLSAMSRHGQLGAISIVTLARRAVKLLIVVAGLIAIAGSLGINLTAWLAALGIGGLAFALGAQKTIEHFIGSLSLIADQPVRVGDFCQVDGIMGTVEDIGMRSTRLRTLDRTMVSIPNGTMSQARIENYGTRDRFKFNALLNLVYATTPDQMREVLWRLRGLLEADERVAEDPRRVRFKGFGASSLDVEVLAYVVATDYNEFLAIQEELNLSILEIVPECGSDFAFPTQTIYWEEKSVMLPSQDGKQT